MATGHENFTHHPGNWRKTVFLEPERNKSNLPRSTHQKSSRQRQASEKF